MRLMEEVGVNPFLIPGGSNPSGIPSSIQKFKQLI